MNSSAPALATKAHHGLATHEVALLLDADPHRGLSSEEAAQRLAHFGPNVLPAATVAVCCCASSASSITR